MTDYKHAWAHLDEVVIHYVTAGDPSNTPLVLIHGYPQSWYCWREVAPRLVDAGYHCIMPDLRGLGESTRPATGFDKKTLAGDIAALLSHLGLAAATLVGHDWGGAVAFALAAHHSDLVDRLVVVDVAIPGDGQPNIGQGGRRWHHTFLQTLDLPEALISGREEIWIRWFYDTYGARPSVIDEQAVAEYLRSYSTPGALRAGFGLYRSVPQDVVDNTDLPTLTIPCLAIGGGSSFGRGVEVEQSLRRMAHDVTGVVFDDCGHWVPEECPDALASTIIQFLSSHEMHSISSPREASPA